MNEYIAGSPESKRSSSVNFARLMEPVARALLGPPNNALSSSTELRFGNHGSMAVDTVQGTWFDHEANEGGAACSI
jgi:hypothetical protein